MSNIVLKIIYELIFFDQPKTSQEILHKLLKRYLISTIVFAVSYLLLTTYLPGNGIVDINDSHPDFYSLLFDSLYFSVITITTTGYGDLYPIGLSRIIASFEVIIGMLLIGLGVARVINVKQEGLIKKLYGFEISRKLEDVCKKINDISINLQKTLSLRGEQKLFAKSVHQISTIDKNLKKIHDVLSGYSKTKLQPDEEDFISVLNSISFFSRVLGTSLPSSNIDFRKNKEFKKSLTELYPKIDKITKWFLKHFPDLKDTIIESQKPLKELSKKGYFKI